MTRKWVFATMLAGFIAVPARAWSHEVTYEGTVAAVEANPYAASSGILARLEVKVTDRKRTVIVDITLYTKLLRGNSTVSFAEARIQRDEFVAVTISDEEPNKGALEIRLTGRK